MTGELDLEVRVTRDLAWHQPLAQAFLAGPHLLLSGVLSVLSIGAAVLIAVGVIVAGRVPRVLAEFQVMTLRERVRCYSYFFALRTSHPPFNLALATDDPGDDPCVRVTIHPLARMRRRDLLGRVVVFGHLVVLIPIAFVMDACYPVWIVLAAAHRGWPPAFRSLLIAVERWVVAFAAYALLVTNDRPAFGLRAYGYTASGHAQSGMPA